MTTRILIRRAWHLAILSTGLGVGSAAVLAAPLAHVELRVGSALYTAKQPATTEEAIAAIEAQLPGPSVFGRTGVSDYIGFKQTFFAADKSAIQVGLLLPVELGGKLLGVHELGGTTVVSEAGASKQGWSSKCPDLEENKPVLTLAHYGKPAPDETPRPMVPNGDLERIYQTHHTRLHHDVARVKFTVVDLANRWVEGVATGEASWIVPKDSDEANNRKTYDWMCRPAEYEMKTESFELKFALHINKSWKP